MNQKILLQNHEIFRPIGQVSDKSKIDLLDIIILKMIQDIIKNNRDFRVV